ncbi:MAG: hypothetical protein JNJ77_08425 [Planctomycetia bacterium]|nr:hypothetical protein [Planctomycetia bacterium]
MRPVLYVGISLVSAFVGFIALDSKPANQQKATRTSLQSQQRIEAHRQAFEVPVVQIVTPPARTDLPCTDDCCKKK